MDYPQYHVVNIPLDAISVPPTRKRPADPAIVQDIARSIARDGLLQPIGVTPSHDGPADQKRWTLVYGLHRVQAVQLLGWSLIAATILPDKLPEATYRLMELQENVARNDLTGSERKSFAAEIGELLAKLAENGQMANGQKNWFTEMAKTAGVAPRTLQNWWKDFCKASGLTLTPKKALKAQQQQFREWLAAHQAQEEAEKARKIEKQDETKRRLRFDDIGNGLHHLAQIYGLLPVCQEIIVPFLHDHDGWSTTIALGHKTSESEPGVE